MFRLKPKLGTGYLVDPYSAKDYTLEDTIKHKFFDDKTLKTIQKSAYPSNGGMSESDFTLIKNQGRIGSCTAHAGVAIMEYYIKKRTGTNYNLSELYLYYVTRFLLGWENRDSGAYLRKTMEALTRFGVPEEKFWVYDTKKWNVAPGNLVSELANDYNAVRYMRIDSINKKPEDVLQSIKSMLNRKFPIMFGFTCYKNALQNAAKSGNIQFPSNQDKKIGGHAVVIIAYDDQHIIKDSNGISNSGAVKIRNSWGTNWGNNGYGWLSYDYILKKYARDFWIMQKADWIQESLFD